MPNLAQLTGQPDHHIKFPNFFAALIIIITKTSSIDSNLNRYSSLKLLNSNSYKKFICKEFFFFYSKIFRTFFILLFCRNLPYRFSKESNCKLQTIIGFRDYPLNLFSQTDSDVRENRFFFFLQLSYMKFIKSRYGLNQRLRFSAKAGYLFYGLS